MGVVAFENRHRQADIIVKIAFDLNDVAHFVGLGRRANDRNADQSHDRECDENFDERKTLLIKARC